MSFRKKTKIEKESTIQFISHENCKDILTGLKEAVITSPILIG